MRFDNCPTCGGKLYTCLKKNIGRVPGQQGDYIRECDFCQDSDGVPTGRICVLSLQELEKLNAQGADLSEGSGMPEPIAVEHSYRLTHRKEGGNDAEA